MIESLFQQTLVPVLEQVMTFAQRRHNILAGNVANIDTPGYRARDISLEQFQDDLKAAISRRDKPPAMRLLGGDDFDQPLGPMIAGLANDAKTILRHDENSVNIEEQVSEMAKNRILHNTALTILMQQFRMLQTAIRERL